MSIEMAEPALEAVPPWRPAGPEALAELIRPCGCVRIELTDREVAVLEQLAEGKSTHAAARCLYVSDQAVTYHVGNLLAKFQCTNRTGLISRAFVLGILSGGWPPRVAELFEGSGTAGRRRCGHTVKDLAYRRTLM